MCWIHLWGNLEKLYIRQKRKLVFQVEKWNGLTWLTIILFSLTYFSFVFYSIFLFNTYSFIHTKYTTFNGVIIITYNNNSDNNESRNVWRTLFSWSTHSCNTFLYTKILWMYVTSRWWYFGMLDMDGKKKKKRMNIIITLYFGLLIVNRFNKLMRIILFWF